MGVIVTIRVRPDCYHHPNSVSNGRSNDAALFESDTTPTMREGRRMTLTTDHDDWLIEAACGGDCRRVLAALSLLLFPHTAVALADEVRAE